jgi:PAS domain S-box-containing protein
MHVLVSDERESSHATRVLLDTTTEGLYGIDVNGRCTMANRAAGEFLGYTPEELIGRDMHDLIHHSRANGSTYPLGECPIYRAISDGEGCEVEEEVFGGETARRSPLPTPRYPILDSGAIRGAVVTFKDIDERKRMEEAIRRRTASAQLHAGPAHRCVRGRQRRTLVYSNHASHELLGAEADTSLEGTDLTQTYRLRSRFRGPYPTERLPVMCALAGETVTVDDIELRQPDGHEVLLEVWAGPIRDRNGDIRYAAAAFTDVSARKETEAALRASEQAVRRASEIADRERKAAERANLAKSEFLSRMSHELRTALNGILGFSQLLGMEELQPSQQDSVTQIYRAGRHLLDLINEVLDLSRVEAGRLSMSLEPIALPELLEECVTQIGPLAAERDIAIALGPEALRCDLRALADRQRMKQILLNLLSNAVKFSRRAGTIEVACERAGEDRVAISVSDTGLGIAPEKVGRLFTEFDRLDIVDEQVEGTGPGLALSRKLAEAKGGTLNATSELGVGSRFTVQLPLAEAVPEPLVEAPAVEHASRGNGLPSTILYIEDNVANIKLIQHILNHRPQVTLETATKRKLGVDIARELRPDLVLLDLNLPDMNGDEVLFRLRGDPMTATIPVVTLSADATGQIKRLMRTGVAAYLTKPLEVEQFLETIDHVVENGAEREKEIQTLAECIMNCSTILGCLHVRITKQLAQLRLLRPMKQRSDLPVPVTCRRRRAWSTESNPEPWSDYAQTG